MWLSTRGILNLQEEHAVCFCSEDVLLDLVFFSTFLVCLFGHTFNKLRCRTSRAFRFVGQIRRRLSSHVVFAIKHTHADGFGVIRLKMALVSHSPEKYRPPPYMTSPNPEHDFSSLPLILSPPLLSLFLSLIMFYIFTFLANCGACGYLVQHSLFPYVTPLHIVCSKGTL